MSVQWIRVTSRAGGEMLVRVAELVRVEQRGTNAFLVMRDYKTSIVVLDSVKEIAALLGEDFEAE